MKNLPLLLGTAALSLASFFAAVSAEPSVYRYSALKRDKTDYAAIAAGCPNKAIPSDYYTYLQATTYREQDLQRSGDALRLFPWENPIIFDPVASGTHLRPFIDSLYIKEPILDPIFLPRKSFLVPYQAGQFIADDAGSTPHSHLPHQSQNIGRRQ